MQSLSPCGHQPNGHSCNFPVGHVHTILDHTAFCYVLFMHGFIISLIYA